MPTISVIIPVYKVERYLDACVASVVGQTYPDLEIILVDDGSPDNCPALCDAWAAKDTRIRVIHPVRMAVYLRLATAGWTSALVITSPLWTAMTALSRKRWNAPCVPSKSLVQI